MQVKREIASGADLRGLLWEEPIPGWLDRVRDTTRTTACELPGQSWLSSHARRHHRSRRLDPLHEPLPVRCFGS